MNDTVIRISGLSFGYEKGEEVLSNLSLDIKKNSINAILGSNGSGKSTLLDCIALFNKPTFGTIEVNGVNAKSLSSKEFAREVAYIPQSTSINIDYTVRDFILFGRSPYLGIGESPDESDYLKCEQYAERMGISHLLEKPITKTSGGERQLAFICRALIQESPILMFDEPLSALDFGNQNKLLLIFKELVKEGKTIIFTTHNPNQVFDLNCNVLVIHEGKITTAGSAKGVITKELLERVYHTNVGLSNNHFTFVE